MRERDLRRRATRLGTATGVLAAAIAGIALGVQSVTDRDQPARPVAASLQGFPEGRWALTGVDGPMGSTVVPASLGASLEFGRDGTILLDDGTNALFGRYSVDGDGFVVQNVTTTLAGYGGNDPVRRAVEGAISTVAVGGGQSGRPQTPAYSRIVSRDDQRLVVQAGQVRLLFERGPSPSPR
jgi:hypothetical protein